MARHKATDARKSYTARWPGPGLAALTNVTFTATSDSAAITVARNKGAKKDLSDAPFMLYRNDPGGRDRLIHQGR